MSFQTEKYGKTGRAAGRVANKVSKKVNAAKEQKKYEKIRATQINIAAVEYPCEYEDEEQFAIVICSAVPRKEMKRYQAKLMTNKRAQRSEQTGRYKDESKEDNEDVNIGNQCDCEFE
jgi:hypothetical protein